MDVFEHAMKMELDGISLYEEELKKTENEGLKSILKMLITQEKTHYSIFEKMQKSSKIRPIKASFKGIKNIFEKMKEENAEFSKDELKFYRKVLDIEKESEKFYKELADKEKDRDTRSQISLIADEEKNHQIILINIIEHINRPNTWLDNAEISHMEDY